jgi:hypothetical protein
LIDTGLHALELVQINMEDLSIDSGKIMIDSERAIRRGWCSSVKRSGKPYDATSGIRKGATGLKRSFPLLAHFPIICFISGNMP